MKQNGWKIGFFTLLALLIIGANVFVWLFWGKGITLEINPTPTLSPTATIKVEPTVTPTPIIDETEAIKEAVFNKTGLTENEALVTINENTGQFAKGGIKEYEAVGGAYWIAAKTNEGWVCVYDGQSQPTCEQIAPYNFPTDMVPECLDENGKVVER